jgi:16S rRNA (guanine966-N2)-methyltransferase
MMRIIGGKYRGQALLCPKGQKVRPTSSKGREALFNICQNTVDEAEFLDLFAGSGAMGLEALSRGANHVTFVDKERSHLQFIEKNLKKMGCIDQTTLVCSDVLRALQQLSYAGKKFAVIYVDPPYMKKAWREGDPVPIIHHCLKLIAAEGLLQEDGDLFLETGKFEPLDELQIDGLELVKKRIFGRSMLRHYRTVKH